jgi:hypothetical protein
MMSKQRIEAKNQITISSLLHISYFVDESNFYRDGSHKKPPVTRMTSIGAREPTLEINFYRQFNYEFFHRNEYLFRDNFFK